MRLGFVANQRCHVMIVQYEENGTLSYFAKQPIHLAGIVEKEQLLVIVQAYLVFITDQQMSFKPMMRRRFA